METYDPSANYIEILDTLWVNPRTGESSGNSELMRLINESDEWKNEACYKMCVATIGYKLKQQKALQKLYDVIQDGTRTSKYFVTVSFSEELFTVDTFKTWWSKMTSKAKVINCRGVLERHSDAGQNTHVHMIIETPFRKGRLLQFIWETAGIKKLISEKNFIDVKEYSERHEEYINGDKRESKVEYVEKDREFRKNNGIPEILSMNNI